MRFLQCIDNRNTLHITYDRNFDLAKTVEFLLERKPDKKIKIIDHIRRWETATKNGYIVAEYG